MRHMLFLLAVVGCSHVDTDDADRRKPKGVDAAIVEETPSGDPAATGVVSCYSQGAPTRTCTNPDYCCFDNYSSHHNGYCTATESCSWGTIRCDGPEDCGSGERCCATATRDPLLGTTSYSLSCRAGSCGGPPVDHELCHPGASTCATGSCVTAYGNANDLPRTLYVCR
jgi:hypothetical protein